MNHIDCQKTKSEDAFVVKPIDKEGNINHKVSFKISSTPFFSDLNYVDITLHQIIYDPILDIHIYTTQELRHKIHRLWI